MFSKACEYAIRAMLFIAEKSAGGERTNLHEIAQGINSPEAFTSKILQVLTKNELLLSMKGPTGGFEINNKKLKTMSLADIVQIIDGPEILSGCVIGLDKCSGDNPCPVHHKYLPIRNDLVEFLKRTYIKDVVKDLNKFKGFIN